jgi:hypothetical protein
VRCIIPRRSERRACSSGVSSAARVCTGVVVSGLPLLPLPLLLAGDGVDMNGVGSATGGERESNSKICASAMVGVGAGGDLQREERHGGMFHGPGQLRRYGCNETSFLTAGQDPPFLSMIETRIGAASH